MRSRVRKSPAPAKSAPISSGLEDLFEERRAPGARAKSHRDIDAAILNAEACAKSGDWSRADARVIVGFYAWCHRSVYGVAPVELENVAEFRLASRAAHRMLHERFDDDVTAMVLMVRWSWRRAKQRAEWLRTQNREINRMGWRLQFSDRMLTDYRVATEGAP